MKKYRYIEIAPSRSAYDPIYLTFENTKTKELIYRKALRWDLKKSMKKFMMTALFQDGTVDLCTVIEDKNPMNGCTFYRVIPSYGNQIMTDENFVACDTIQELTKEIYLEHKHMETLKLKEMNS